MHLLDYTDHKTWKAQWQVIWMNLLIAFTGTLAILQLHPTRLWQSTRHSPETQPNDQINLWADGLTVQNALLTHSPGMQSLHLLSGQLLKVLDNQQVGRLAPAHHLILLTYLLHATDGKKFCDPINDPNQVRARLRSTGHSFKDNPYLVTFVLLNLAAAAVDSIPRRALPSDLPCYSFLTQGPRQFFLPQKVIKPRLRSMYGLNNLHKYWNVLGIECLIASSGAGNLSSDSSVQHGATVCLIQPRMVA
jgi:hypothetical protein